MGKLAEFLRENSTIPTTVLTILLCSITCLIREAVPIPSHITAYINLVMVCVLLVIIFVAARKRRIQWRYVVRILALFFVFNRFYDEATFLNVFHFELLRFSIAVVGIVAVSALHPIIKNAFRKAGAKTSELVGAWADRKIKEEEQVQNDLQKQQAEEAAQVGTYTKRESISSSKSESVLNSKQDSSNGKPAKGLRGTPKDSALYAIIFMVVLVVLLIISGILLFVALSSQISGNINKVSLQNWPTAVFSIIAVFVMLVFIVGITVSLLIKWTQIIIELALRKHKGEMYLVFACFLFLLSQYAFTLYPFTTDDVVDLLLGGKLFTFPLILSILVPVFLIFAENIIAFTSQNAQIKESLKRCGKQTFEIAKGIVQSLLNFVAFVTSDFLSTIIELTEEEENSEADEDGEVNEDGEVDEADEN